MFWLYFSLYMAAAVAFYIKENKINEDLKQSKHFARHPDMHPVGTKLTLVLTSLLWPLQILGFVIGCFVK